MAQISFAFSRGEYNDQIYLYMKLTMQNANCIIIMEIGLCSKAFLEQIWYCKTRKIPQNKLENQSLCDQAFRQLKTNYKSIAITWKQSR